MLSDNSRTFSCPYCGSDNDLMVDPTGGRRQKFVVDCEICCQPVTVELSMSPVFLDIHVRRENE